MVHMDHVRGIDCDVTRQNGRLSREGVAPRRSLVPIRFLVLDLKSDSTFVRHRPPGAPPTERFSVPRRSTHWAAPSTSQNLPLLPAEDQNSKAGSERIYGRSSTAFCCPTLRLRCASITTLGDRCVDALLKGDRSISTNLEPETHTQRVLIRLA